MYPIHHTQPNGACSRIEFTCGDGVGPDAQFEVAAAVAAAAAAAADAQSAIEPSIMEALPCTHISTYAIELDITCVGPELLKVHIAKQGNSISFNSIYLN